MPDEMGMIVGLLAGGFVGVFVGIFVGWSWREWALIAGPEDDCGATGRHGTYGDAQYYRVPAHVWEAAREDYREGRRLRAE